MTRIFESNIEQFARIAVELYAEIVKLRPEWHDAELDKGAIKVVMTSNPSDPESWQGHNTNKENIKEIAARFKDTGNSLKMVLVRDMWLTGFDVPCPRCWKSTKWLRRCSCLRRERRGRQVIDSTTRNIPPPIRRKSLF